MGKGCIKGTGLGLAIVKRLIELHGGSVEVSDTGVGIPSEYINNLFDRFYQGDGSTKRKYGGTGLGLHISKLIVEAHNGKIWAESEGGVGATIHVTLPKNSQKPSNIN